MTPPDTAYDTNIQKIRERFSSISIRKAAIITFFAMLPFGLILFITASALDIKGLRMELILSKTPYLVTLGLIFYAFRIKKLSLIPILKDNGKYRGEILLVLPLIVFSITVVWIAILFLNLASSSVAQSYLDYMNSIEFLVTSEDTPLIDYLFIFIAIAILPPLLEEIVFRGAMIERLGRKYSYKTALIISSVLFGVMHIDIVGALTFGVILSLIYLKTGSLFIPILIHVINNGLVVIFMFMDDQFLQIDPWLTIEPYIEYSWIAILLFILSSGWLIKYIKNNWHFVHDKEPVRGVVEAKPDKNQDNKFSPVP